LEKLQLPTSADAPALDVTQLAQQTVVEIPRDSLGAFVTRVLLELFPGATIGFLERVKRLSALQTVLATRIVCVMEDLRVQSHGSRIMVVPNMLGHAAKQIVQLEHA